MTNVDAMLKIADALNSVAKAIHQHGQNTSDVGPALERLAVETGSIGASLAEGLGDIETQMARMSDLSND